MELTRDELLALCKDTWASDDAAERTTNSLKITDALNALFAEMDGKDSVVADLNNKIDDLRRVNSELYTRVTSPVQQPNHEAHEEVDEIEKVLEEYSDGEN